MTACQLNFLSNITCITNLTEISLNNTRAPYYCVNNITYAPCTNNSECCRSGYEFSTDVQQCLCKYLLILHRKKFKFFFSSSVRPVCNGTVCGGNNTCQNSELETNGYFCMCNSTSIFNGITCVRMYSFFFF